VYLRDVPLVGTSGYSGQINPGVQPSPIKGFMQMKNPFEVLRTKEQEIAKIKREIDALRITIQLIGEDKMPPAPDQKVDLRSVIEMP
jgi:hypothetical protein